MKMKKIIKHYKIVAIAVLILGTIHTLATPLVAKDLSFLAKDVLNVFLLMFIATGIAMVYAGILFLYDVKQMKQHAAHSSIIPLSTILFTTIVGILACSLGSDNPFTWITLAVGIYGCIVLLYHQSQKNRLLQSI
jgi:cytochrome bd-type quinol oxidase subunit 2